LAENSNAREAAIKNNIVADDYFGLADGIRKDFKIDYIIGITPSMVACEDQDEIYWNHFSTFSHRAILVSTYQLRDFAEKTDRPFEAFLGGIIVAQLLVAKFYPKVGFHDNRGCLFDYNADRISLMDKVRDLKIESECLKGITPRYRPAAQSLIDFLRKLEKD
jgi:hypothetical protein